MKPSCSKSVVLNCYICRGLSKYLSLVDKKSCLYQNVCYNKYIDINKRNGENKMKRYINTQGQLFTESQAKEYYGNRFESAVLVLVLVNEDMEVICEA